MKSASREERISRVSVADVMASIRAQWPACPSSPSEALRWLDQQQVRLEESGLEADHQGHNYELYMDLFRSWMALSRAIRKEEAKG